MAKTTPKKAIFKAGTRELIDKINNIRAHYELIGPYDITKTIVKMRAAFCIRPIRQDVLPTGLTEKYNFEDELYAAGFCNIASYIIAHTFTGANGTQVWQPYQLTGVPGFGSHVWLKFIPTGEILDITHDQYTTTDLDTVKIPYDDLGHPTNINFQFPAAYKLAEHINHNLADTLRKNTSDMPPLPADNSR